MHIAGPRSVAVEQHTSARCLGGDERMTDIRTEMQYRRYANTGLGEWVPEMGVSLGRAADEPSDAAAPMRAEEEPPEMEHEMLSVQTQSQTQPQPQPGAFEHVDIARPVKAPPRQGWRKLVHGATGGKLNPGQSRRQPRPPTNPLQRQLEGVF